jgi:hypothetical protein
MDDGRARQVSSEGDGRRGAKRRGDSRRTVGKSGLVQDQNHMVERPWNDVIPYPKNLEDVGKCAGRLRDADIVNPEDVSVSGFDLGTAIVVSGKVTVSQGDVMVSGLRLVHVLRCERGGHRQPGHKCRSDHDAYHRPHTVRRLYPEPACWVVRTLRGMRVPFRASKAPARRGARSAHRAYVSGEQRSPAGCIGVQNDAVIPGRVLTTHQLATEYRLFARVSQSYRSTFSGHRL